MFPHGRVASSEDVGEARQRVSHGAGARASVRTRPDLDPEPDPDLDPDLEPKPNVSTRETGGERMKCERNPPRNAAKHQNASDSSGTLSRQHAASSFIPWQSPPAGSCSAYADSAAASRFACADCHVGRLAEGVWVSDRSSRSSSHSAARSARQCAAKGPRRNADRGTSARMTGAASVCVPRSSGDPRRFRGWGFAGRLVRGGARGCGGGGAAFAREEALELVASRAERPVGVATRAPALLLLHRGVPGLAQAEEQRPHLRAKGGVHAAARDATQDRVQAVAHATVAVRRGAPLPLA